MKLKIHGKIYDTKTTTPMMKDGNKILCKTPKGNFFFFQKNEKTGEYVIVPIKCFEAYMWLKSFEQVEVRNFAASPELMKLLQGG